MTNRTVVLGHGINPNTILLGLVLAISGYSLKKLFDIGEQQSAMKAQIENLERVVYSRE